MTPEQRKHLSELRSVVVTNRLIGCNYINSDGCCCIIGHMGKAVGVIDTLRENNGSGIDSLYRERPVEIKKILDHYGLTFDQLFNLQMVNDGADFVSERVRKVKEHIEKLINL